MKLKIENKTRWRTGDLQKIFTAGLRALGAKGDKHVTVTTTRRRGTHGYAYLGRVDKKICGEGYRRREACGIRMMLPTPDKLEVASSGRAGGLAELCRVWEHEVRHTLGVHHADMTPDQLYCRGGLPTWAEGLVLREREAPAKKAPEERAAERAERAREKAAARAEKARRMLAAHERKLAQEKRLVAKWRKRVRYHERQEEKRRQLRLLGEVGVFVEEREAASKEATG